MKESFATSLTQRSHLQQVYRGRVDKKESSAASLSEGVIPAEGVVRGEVVRRSHPRRACPKESSVASLSKGVICGQLVRRSHPWRACPKESSVASLFKGVIRGELV